MADVTLEQVRKLAARVRAVVRNYGTGYYDIVGRAGAVFGGTLDECAAYLLGYVQGTQPTPRKNPWYGKKGNGRPHEVADKVAGTVGDVNPIEYGGGFVFRNEYGYRIEYTHGEDGSEGTPLELYSVFVENDVVEALDWVNWGSVAATVGSTAKNLRAAAKSKKLMDRVYAIQAVASHYGWNALDNDPQNMTPAELRMRWRKALRAKHNPAVSTRAGKWTQKYKDALPDSAFLIIDKRGDAKTIKGKTHPLSRRHLPFKDKSGKVNLDHLRNAIARAPQTTSVPMRDRKAAQARARALLKRIEGK